MKVKDRGRGILLGADGRTYVCNGDGCVTSPIGEIFEIVEWDDNDNVTAIEEVAK